MYVVYAVEGGRSYDVGGGENAKREACLLNVAAEPAKYSHTPKNLHLPDSRFGFRLIP